MCFVTFRSSQTTKELQKEKDVNSSNYIYFTYLLVDIDCYITQFPFCGNTESMDFREKFGFSWKKASLLFIILSSFFVLVTR